MADTAPAKVTPKKKVSKPKAPAAHPKYSEMIAAAVKALKERSGSSRQAILKHIMANNKVGNDEKSVNAHLKMALRAGVKKGSLKQAKGTGASGSFRLGEKPAAKKAAAKKPAKKAVKPKKAAAKKPKASPKKKTAAKKAKPAAKKAAKPKKPAAKSPKKAAKPKAKKPAAKKVAKK